MNTRTIPTRRLLAAGLLTLTLGGACATLGAFPAAAMTLAAQNSDTSVEASAEADSAGTDAAVSADASATEHATALAENSASVEADASADASATAASSSESSTATSGGGDTSTGGEGDTSPGGALPLEPCPAPENVTVVDLTETTATLIWTLPDGSDRYDDYPAVVTGVPWAMAPDATVPNIRSLLSGLTPGTAYDVGVYFACEGGGWTDKQSLRFTTPGQKPVHNYYSEAAANASASGISSGAADAGSAAAANADAGGTTAAEADASGTTAAEAAASGTTSAVEGLDDAAAEGPGTAESDPGEPAAGKTTSPVVATGTGDTLATTGADPINPLSIGGAAAALAGLGLTVTALVRRVTE